MRTIERPQPTVKRQAWLAIMERVEAMMIQQYPSMPPRSRAKCILHACAPNCGRIFSTNDEGRIPEITPALVTRAVRAHIRHKHTDYDKISVFNSHGKSRKMVEDQVKEKMKQWRQTS